MIDIHCALATGGQYYKNDDVITKTLFKAMHSSMDDNLNILHSSCCNYDVVAFIILAIVQELLVECWCNGNPHRHSSRFTFRRFCSLCSNQTWLRLYLNVSQVFFPIVLTLNNSYTSCSLEKKVSCRN